MAVPLKCLHPSASTVSAVSTRPHSAAVGTFRDITANALLALHPPLQPLWTNLHHRRLVKFYIKETLVDVK